MDMDRKQLRNLFWKDPPRWMSLVLPVKSYWIHLTVSGHDSSLALCDLPCWWRSLVLGILSNLFLHLQANENRLIFSHHGAVERWLQSRESISRTNRQSQARSYSVESHIARHGRQTARHSVTQAPQANLVEIL